MTPVAFAAPTVRVPCLLMTPVRAVLLGLCLPAMITGVAMAQQPPSPPRAPTKTGARSVPKDTLTQSEQERLRETERDARSIARGRLGGDSVVRRMRADSASASAFGSPEARAILAKAREVREQQDSAHKSYRATTTQRISVSMGVRKIGLEKLMYRSDNVSKISWKRGVGVWMTPIGSRMTIPMAEQVTGSMVGVAFDNANGFPLRVQETQRARK